MRFPLPPRLLRRTVRALALLLAPLAPAAQAQAPSPPQPQQQHPAPQPTVTVPLASVENPALHPALWKVADADTTIWLFGTVHALPKGLNWLNGPVAAALDGSDELVTELPAVDPSATAALVVQKGTLPAGQTLRGMLGPKDAARLEAALVRYKQSPAALDRLKPWYAAIVLGSLPLLHSGITGAQGVEDALAARARAAGKPRAGLETMAEQLGLFDGLPMKEQKRLLMEAIDGDGDTVSELSGMVDQWGSGHVEALAATLRKGGLDGLMGKTLIDQRNARWADWVQQRLTTPGTVFVAVGAGHLAGKGSVIDALPRRGIPVTRVQ